LKIVLVRTSCFLRLLWHPVSFLTVNSLQLYK
jgi:hypothetical protein